MADINLHIPSHVLLGLDAVNRLGPIVSEFGERVLIVTEAILYEPKIIEKISTLLGKRGIQYIIFDEIVPNATSSSVDEGVSLARGSHADLIIGLGGIKTLSIAKSIAMTTPVENDMDDFLSGVQPKGIPLSYVEIPTTCRNPFMLSDEYFIVDAKDRTARIGKTQSNITKAVIIDPKLSQSLPKKYTLTTMFDTMLCAIEGMLSQKTNYLADTLFTKAIEILGRTIPLLQNEPDDIRHRTNASTAGMLTAIGLSMSKMGIGAALSYSINARFMVPKSWISTILLPHIMEFNMSASTEKLAAISRLLQEENIDIESAEDEDINEKINKHAPIEEANAAVETVRGFIGSADLATRLRDFDLDLDDMIEIAGSARSFDMMNYLPRLVSTEDLYEIIKAAF
ncbi:MAG: iron-containing alcohol dehydrogenase [Spirochaetes bacterium]|nr:iron-containing alcohol dehydrogenase [Spirochaetota bacterium]